MNEPLSNAAGGRRFHTGVFVGIDRRTAQYMLYSDEGVKLARTVMRFPDANKLDKDVLSGVRASPWDLHQAKESEVVFKPKEAQAEQDFQTKVSLSRQVYLRASDFEEHGMTRGCPKVRSLHATWVLGHKTALVGVQDEDHT